MKFLLPFLLLVLFLLALVNIIERSKLENRVDFLEVQWKGQVFWHTNTVWKTNYFNLIIKETP